MSRLAVIWRFARRNSLLTRGQAAMIVVLIALPIVGFSGAMLILQSSAATRTEQLTAVLGHTQSELRAVSAPDPTLRQKPAGSTNWDVARDEHGNPTHTTKDGTFVSPQSVLPAGTRVLRVADSMAEVTTATGVADLPVTLGPVWDPSLSGRFDVIAGRAPSTPEEIAVSEPTLARLGVGLGDAIHLEKPRAAEYTVTAVVADTRGPRSVQELFLPDGAFDGTSSEPAPTSYSYYLPTLDLNTAQLRAVNRAGFIGTSRALVAHGTEIWGVSGTEGPLYLVLGLAVLFGSFEVVLLSGSAFFIGARARQRVLAIVASTGASRRMLAGIVTFTGATIGLIGGVAGVAAGIGAGSLWMALTADGSADHYPGYHLNWPTQLLIWLFAGLVGYAAAVLPARSVSRFDVVLALRGATRPPVQRRRRPVVGIVLTLAGVAVTVGTGVLLAGVSSGWFNGPPGYPSLIERHSVRISELLDYALTGGVILTQIGLIVAAGMILRGASTLLRRLGIATTLASRDLDRNRSRAVPAIASIMVTSFLAVLAMGFIISSAATNAAQWQWATIENQVVGYWSSGTKVPVQPDRDQLAQLETELSRTLPVHGGFTVVSGVPGPDWGQDPSTDTALYPAPLTPTSQLCPARDSAGDIVLSSTSHDWRCSDPWAGLSASDEGIPLITVGDDSTLAAILGHAPSAAAKAALADGGAVSLHRAFVADGKLTIGWYSATATESGLMNAKSLESPIRAATVPAVLETTPHPIGFRIVISPATAERLGLAVTKQSIVAQLTRAPTTAETDALYAATQVLSPPDVDGNQGSYGARVETGSSDQSGPWLWGALVASSLIAIGSAVVALTLARQDGARDDAVFAAVGASPLMRRRLAFWQAVVLVGAGALLGAATATLTVFAVMGAGGDSVFAMPWLQVVLGTVGLTVVVAGGAWLSAGRLRSGETGRRAIA